MGGVTPFCWLAARQYTHAACAMCVIPAAKVLLWAPVPAGMPLSHALFGMHWRGQWPTCGGEWHVCVTI